MKKKVTLANQLKGVNQLVCQMICEISVLTENAQMELASGPKIFGEPLKPWLQRINSPIHRLIRGGAKLTKMTIDACINVSGPILPQHEIHPKTWNSVLNGVVGNHLQKSNNDLALSMEFCVNRRPITDESLIQLLKNTQSETLVILIHGSCLNDFSWTTAPKNISDQLTSRANTTTLYLRYNSGLAISQNGKFLAELLNQISNTFPESLKRIILIGHSMGGLVARSACLHGEKQLFPWRKKVQVLVTLGTPHRGAQLERFGELVDTILASNKYTHAFQPITAFRSAGIKDLSTGNISDLSHENHTRPRTKSIDAQTSEKLPNDIVCFAIAGSLKTKRGRHLSSDGLVSVKSALGIHNNLDSKFQFKNENTWIAQDCGHMELLKDERVANKILEWLNPYH